MKSTYVWYVLVEIAIITVGGGSVGGETSIYTVYICGDNRLVVKLVLVVIDWYY